MFGFIGKFIMFVLILGVIGGIAHSCDPDTLEYPKKFYPVTKIRNAMAHQNRTIIFSYNDGNGCTNCYYEAYATRIVLDESPSYRRLEVGSYTVKLSHPHIFDQKLVVRGNKNSLTPIVSAIESFGLEPEYE